jgi:hypothetical protein
MKIAVVHSSRYRCDVPVYLEPHIFRLRPRACGSPRLLEFDLEITRTPAGASECPVQNGPLAGPHRRNLRAQSLHGRDAAGMLTRLHPGRMHLPLWRHDQVSRNDGPPWTSDEVPSLGEGSCPDLALLCCDARHVMGIAGRFVRGCESASTGRPNANIDALAEVFLPATGCPGYDHELTSLIAGWYSGGSPSHMDSPWNLQVQHAW